MTFDNKKFENGVRTTINSLDALKKSLRLESSAKSLTSLESTANKLSFSGLSRSVETISNRFSALGIIGMTALQNITNSAMRAGEQLLKSFTIEPITAGFNEYETQIKSVQTILANTSHNGTTLQQVNTALDELNRYADMTIYNFTEMTKNIGTFTAAGLDLDTSVQAIKGIANLAAVSGSTSAQASTAMYQLSQALANGRVNLQDWNSVVNAGMGGKVFQDALIRTAAAMEGITEEAFRAKNVTGSFRESLNAQSGTGWLTTDVLSNTLRQFTGDMSNAELAAMGFTEAQIQSIQAMAVTANEAATKVKTYTQLMDTLKESAQSGWTQSWEYVLGDFEEAKDLFTMISDAIGGMLNDSAEDRNDRLAAGLSSGWKQILAAGIGDAARFEEIVSEVAKEHEITLDEWIATDTSFVKTLKRGWLSADILGESINRFADSVSNMSAEELEASGYTQQMVDDILKLQEEIQNGSISMEEFSKKIAGLSGRDHLIQALKNSFNGLMSVVAPISSAFDEIFPAATGDQIYNMAEQLSIFTSKLMLSEDAASNLQDSFEGFFSIFSIGLKGLKAFGGGVFEVAKTLLPIGGSFLEFTGSIGRNIVAFEDWLDSVNAFEKGFGAFTNVLRIGKDLLVEWAMQSEAMPYIQKGFATAQKNVAAFQKFMVSAGNGLMQFIDRLSKLDKVTLADVKSAFQEFCDNTIGQFIDVDAAIAAAKNGIAKFKTGAIDLLKKAGIGFESFKETVGDVLEYIGKKLDEITFGDIVGVGLVASLFTAAFAVKGVGKIFSEAFDAIIGSMKAVENWANSKALVNMAIAIAIFAGSIALLTALDMDKVADAAKILGIFAASMVGITTLLSFMTKKGWLGAIDTNVYSIVAIAGAMLLFASSLRVIEGLDTDGLLPKVAYLVGVMAAAAAMVGVLGKLVPKLSSGSLVMLSYAGAIRILVNCLQELSGMDITGIEDSMTILFQLMGAMALVSLASSFTTAGAGIAMLGMVTSLWLIIKVLKDLEGISPEAITKNLDSLTGVFAVLAGLMISTKFAGKNAAGGGIAVLAMVGSMYLIINLLEELSSLDISGLGAATGVITAIMAVMGVFVALTNFAGPNAAKAAVAIVAMTVCVAALSGVISLLSNIRPGDLVMPTLAIIGLMGMFALLLVASSKAVGATGALIGMTLAIGILAGALYILSGIDTETLIYTAAALGGVMLAVGGALALSSGAVASWPAVLAMGLVIAAVGASLYALASLPTQNAMLAALSLGATLLVAFGTVALFSLFPAPAALSAIGSFAIVIAGLFAIVTTLSALGSLLDSVGVDITRGIEMMGDIGSAIGTFVGGLVGGFAAGVTDNFVKIGEDLSAFMEAAQPFFDGVQGTQSSLDGIKSLAEAMLLLTANDWINMDWFGDSTLVEFGKELALFGPEFAKFIEAISGQDIDPTAMQSVADAVRALAEMSSAMPKEGGLMSSILGQSNMADFGTQLASFGEALVAYSQSVQELTPDSITAIETSVDAANSLSELASALPNTGGLVGLLAGENNIGAFGSELESFGSSLVSYAKSVEGLTPDSITAIDNSVKAANSLSELATALPNTGGLAAFFAGDNAMDSFGTQLESFGSSLVAYSTSVAGLANGGLESIDNSITAAKALVELANIVPNFVGLKQIFTGEGSLSTFGADMQSFGNSLTAYSTSVAGLDITGIQNATAAVASLVALATSASGVDFSSFGSFGESLGQVANTGVDGFVAAFAEAEPRIQTAGNNAITTFVTAMKSKIPDVRTAADAVTTAAISAVNAKKSEWNSAGYNAMAGMANGIRSGQYLVVSAAEAAAAAALSAAKAKLDEHSPSKAFEEVGYFGSAGMGIGFLNGISLVTSAVDNIGDAAIDRMTDTIAYIGEVFSNAAFDSTPSIRPVLDLSGVEAGARRIGGMLSGTRTLDLSASVDRTNSVASTMRSSGSDGSSETTPTVGGTNLTFNQYNNSPKPLSRIEIYRQTNNQISQAKEALSRV